MTLSVYGICDTLRRAASLFSKNSKLFLVQFFAFWVLASKKWKDLKQSNNIRLIETVIYTISSKRLKDVVLNFSDTPVKDSSLMIYYTPAFHVEQ